MGDPGSIPAQGLFIKVRAVFGGKFKHIKLYVEDHLSKNFLTYSHSSEFVVQWWKKQTRQDIMPLTILLF